ncbi:MAG: VWA domain-containing protein [Acidobacteria bacterium]|nr:VWA domain-containing protein [Acidobacteriota bacterium]
MARPIAAVACLCAILSGTEAWAQPAPLTVRLTSPLGRTGVPGVIRVVAQVQSTAPEGRLPVRFFVDDALIGLDEDGPPYSVEWTDENPYEARRIRVEASTVDDIASDEVTLPPLEVLEETTVSSVLVEATVVDADGRYVGWLEKGDFTLFEDGAPQPLDLVQLQEVPTTFTLLVDASQSLNRRIRMVRAAALRLASKLRPGDRVIIAPFRTTVDATTGPTDDPTTIADAVSAIRSRGGTAILDALSTLPDKFSAIEGRHVVILITDGYDEQSKTTYDDALRALQRLQATVYVVGIGGVAGISLKGELLLRRIATQMGGRAFFPTREEELPDVHAAVAADAFRRYLLSYTPENQAADGRFRAITLKVVNPDYRIRTREGYFAPKPPPVRATIEFSAADVAGATPNLAIDDLRVTEDGVPQKVDTFQEAVAPISIAMLLDTSGSMRRALPAAQDAARAFVTALRPTDPLALIRFSDRVVFEHELSERREATLDAIGRLTASGGTALFDGLHDSMAFLRQRPGRRAIVLLSDGRDENNPGTGPGSQHTLDDVLALLRETDTVVYAIGLGASVDRPALEQLAERSGGLALFPADTDSLEAEYRRVLGDLRRRYVLAYTSTNSLRDGAWREVSVTTTAPAVTIRAGRGYFAPVAARRP